MWDWMLVDQLTRWLDIKGQHDTLTNLVNKLSRKQQQWSPVQKWPQISAKPAMSIQISIFKSNAQVSRITSVEPAGRSVARMKIPECQLPFFWDGWVPRGSHCLGPLVHTASHTAHGYSWPCGQLLVWSRCLPQAGEKGQQHMIRGSLAHRGRR